MNVNDDRNENFFTEFGEIDGAQTVAVLRNQSVFHAFTKADIFNQKSSESTFKLTKDSVFTFNDRYTSEIFQGILPDSGAAGVSTAGESQCAALQTLNSSIQIDSSTAGNYRIQI